MTEADQNAKLDELRENLSLAGKSCNLILPINIDTIGPFNLVALQSAQEHVRHYFRSSATKPEFRDLLTSIVGSGNVNAFAAKYSSYHIVFESGMLDMPWVFASIASRGGTTSTDKEIRVSQKAHPLRSAFQELVDRDLEISNFQFLESSFMLHLLWSFINMHEMAHIAHGHVRYINELFNMSGINEKAALDANAEFALTMQCFELDADALATNFIVQIAMKDFDFLGISQTCDIHNVPKNYFTPKRKLRLIATAYYALWRLLDNDPWCQEDIKYRTHPYSFERLLHLMHMLCEYKIRFGIETLNDEEIAEIFCLGIGAAEEVINVRVSKKSGIVSMILNEVDRYHANTINRLRRYAEIRPVLQELKLQDEDLAPASF